MASDGIRPPTDRQDFYRFLWDHRDHRNVLGMPAGVAAREYGICYQHISDLLKEFCEIGLVKKNKHQFLLVYDPDRVPWDKFEVLRQRYILKKKRSKSSTGGSNV